MKVLLNGANWRLLEEKDGLCLEKQVIALTSKLDQTDPRIEQRPFTTRTKGKRIFGAFLRCCRRSANYTLGSFAEAIGIPIVILSDFERGERLPPGTLTLMMAQKLEVSELLFLHVRDDAMEHKE